MPLQNISQEPPSRSNTAIKIWRRALAEHCSDELNAIHILVDHPHHHISGYAARGIGGDVAADGGRALTRQISSRGSPKASNDWWSGR